MGFGFAVGLLSLDPGDIAQVICLRLVVTIHSFCFAFEVIEFSRCVSAPTLCF